MLISRLPAKSRSSAHTGEGYLASSADLMIGILFIFIIMVVYLAVEIKRVSTPAQTADPVGTLVKKIGEGLQGKGVRVEVDPDSGVIALPSDALFDSGKAVPTAGALEAISKTEEVLRAVLPCYVSTAARRARSCDELNEKGVELETVMIEGHTDSDQYLNDPSRNWHLGLDRARYIFEELGKGELGGYKNKKGQPLLGVSSYADTRPSKISSKAIDRKAKDRRVELRFILSYQGEGTNTPSSQLTEAVRRR